MNNQILEVPDDFESEFEAYVSAGDNNVAGAEVMATILECGTLGCTVLGC